MIQQFQIVFFSRLKLTLSHLHPLMIPLFDTKPYSQTKLPGKILHIL